MGLEFYRRLLGIKWVLSRCITYLAWRIKRLNIYDLL